MAARALIPLAAAAALGLALAGPVTGQDGDPGRRDWRVLFAWDETRMVGPAASVLQAFAAYARETQPAMVLVVGHADTSGDPLYNQDLSLRRAAVVAEALRAEGVDRRIIEMEGRGESEPLAPTGDGVAEPRNRRAEILWLK